MNMVHMLQGYVMTSEFHKYLNDPSGWESLAINKREPITIRLFRQIGEYRFCLHRFTACDHDEAVMHPHPWPAAFRILRGGYWMGLGRSPDLVTKKVTMTSHLYLPEGSIYSITDPHVWHSVEPDKETWTIMINGPDFQHMHEAVRRTAGKGLSPVSPESVARDLGVFRQLLTLK